MPSLTTTIEEYSPLLSFSEGWDAGTSVTDDLASRYSMSSFMATEREGATMTFTFNGTGVQIFGSKRDNHGNFQVNIDGLNSAMLNTKGGNEFKTSIFNADNLAPGLHTLTLTNREARFVDVDFITWKNNIGSTNEPLAVSTVQDSDSTFQYSPPTAWSTTPDNVGAYLGGSGHATTTAGASMTYSFSGDAVALYGPVGPDFADFVVQIDGGPLSPPRSATQANFIPQTLLYRADNLGRGSHLLKLFYRPSKPGQILAVDFANIYTTPSIGGGTSAPQVAASSSTSAGAIAGIVLGVLIALGLLGACGFFFWRRHRSRGRYNQDTPSSMEKYAQSYPEATPFPQTAAVRSSFGNLNGQPSALITPVPQPTYYQPSTYQESASNYYGSPTDESISMGRSVSFRDPRVAALRDDDTRSMTSSSYHSSSAHQSNSAGGSGPSNSTSPRQSSLPRFSGKGQRLQLPSAAGQNLQTVSSDELRNHRLQVDGRPQDFGSVQVADDGAGPSGERPFSSRTDALPPPNYSQATEPYPRRV